MSTPSGSIDDSHDDDHVVADGIGLRAHGMWTEVILARPEVHNVLNLPMWRRLCSVFEAFAGEQDVRAVVVRGAGERAFSAGADIREFSRERVGAAAARAYNEVVSRTLESIRNCPCPVIAAIRGVAVGGGCEIAAVCDIRVAERGARLGVPISRLGVTVGPAEAAALVSLIGVGHAKDLLLTGRIVDADTALQIGLVDRVVTQGELTEAVNQIVKAVVDGAPLAGRINKAVINRVSSGAGTVSDDEMARWTEAIYDSQDLREGIAAFLEKREPRFLGK